MRSAVARLHPSSRRSKLAGWTVVLVLLGGPLAGSASAQGGEEGPPAWAYSMAHDLMSPFCPGRTLAACPSGQADELRQWILLQAAAERTRADIEESLYERFGDVILSQPRAEGGWGVSAYAVPIGGFLLGGSVVVFVLRRIVRGAGSAAPAAVSVPGRMGAPEGRAPRRVVDDAELERLVEEELAAR